MTSKKIKNTLRIKYRVYFLIASTLVLIFYSFLNLTIYADRFKAYGCLFLSLLTIFQTFYILRSDKVFLNHILELSTLILLLLLLPIFGKDIERARMWIFLLPLVSFYTQGFKKGMFFIYSFTGIALITYVYSIFVPIQELPIYTKEQTFVFILITILAYLYERILKNNKLKLNKQLYTDSLTGFPNRRSLVKDLIEMSGNEEIILLLINIDDFKEVNDLFGSAIGDLIILHLRTIIDDNNSIKILHRYRLHSDEFAIIISKKEISEFNKFVENLIHQITETFYVGIDEISITASIGISIGRSNHLEKADMALQKAKERKKHAVYFDPSLNTIETYNSNRLMLLNLRKAIKTDNIVPFFQPIYDNAIKKLHTMNH